MNILKFIEICHKRYSRPERCPDCPNNDCKDSCSLCLDDIHMNRIKRRYNCTNITYCYVCKYILKYSSEIFHLFNNHAVLGNLNNLKIWSIGCGPCSDLWGITEWMQVNNRRHKITYVGFDLNNTWQKIQDIVKSFSRKSHYNIQIKIYNKNIFTIYRQLKTLNGVLPVNILMMQYVISDMVSNNMDINLFLERSVDLIINKMRSGSFIIINDINHHTQSRDYFENLSSILNQQGNFIITRYHFVHNRSNYIKYGTQHPDNKLYISIPEEIIDYNPWSFCSSAQMIIQKI